MLQYAEDALIVKHLAGTKCEFIIAKQRNQKLLYIAQVLYKLCTFERISFVWCAQ